MNKIWHLIYALALLQACATSSKKTATTPLETKPPGIEEKMDARVEETHQAEEPPHETKEAEALPAPPEPTTPAPRAPVIGVWIEGAGVESIMALGFMQELQRSGVKFSKVVGTGWGCWMALSWADEASANQAEWQAFKWSSWSPLGLEKGFLSRLRGERGDFDSFAKDIRVWLPKEKFSELAMPADCPLLGVSSTMDLVSSRSLGIYRALWEELQVPLFNKNVTTDTESVAYMSGLAAGDPRLEEYDRFAEAGKTPVEFWIHLKASPAAVLAPGDRWLSAAFARRELKGESWTKTKQGRWVMRMPLFIGQNLQESKSLDFGSRRAMLLRGRDLARSWMQTAWFKSNLAPAFATPGTP
ncbi:MAG: patatin-like phospholipase family protein [Bdellovibrionota bacterium]